MNSVIEKVYKVILECPGAAKDFRSCIKSHVDRVVRESMELVASGRLSKTDLKREIRQKVQESLLECASSRLDDDTKKVSTCIQTNVNQLISLAVDIMVELVKPYKMRARSPRKRSTRRSRNRK
jgi:hypothetical protein